VRQVCQQLRNELAHTLTATLFHGLPAEIAERLGEMVSLLDKIERWWIVNVEIATDPNLKDEEIDEAQVIPGPIMGLRLLLDIALGSEEESKKRLDEFKRLSATTQLNSRKSTRKVPQPEQDGREE
jgi:hypothetical protein